MNFKCVEILGNTLHIVIFSLGFGSDNQLVELEIPFNSSLGISRVGPPAAIDFSVADCAMCSYTVVLSVIHLQPSSGLHLYSVLDRSAGRGPSPCELE